VERKIDWFCGMLHHWYFFFYQGYFIQMMSFGSFLSAVAGSPAKFAILYSFGNIVALVG
jgi:hypothetical protein